MLVVDFEFVSSQKRHNMNTFKLLESATVAVCLFGFLSEQIFDSIDK